MMLHKVLDIWRTYSYHLFLCIWVANLVAVSMSPAFSSCVNFWWTNSLQFRASSCTFFWYKGKLSPTWAIFGVIFFLHKCDINLYPKVYNLEKLTLPCGLVERPIVLLAASSWELCEKIQAYGIHMNGYVHFGGEKHLWVAKRSATKQTYPGMLDHLVAGGQVSSPSNELVFKVKFLG